MKFRDVVGYAWKIALLLFTIEAVRWWLGADPNWRRALDYSLWGAALLLCVAWGHKDEETDAKLAELERWRRAWAEHDRWMAEFPDVDLVLSNLKAHAEGRELSLLWPPAEYGPWEVSRLQEVLRRSWAQRGWQQARAHVHHGVGGAETTGPA